MKVLILIADGFDDVQLFCPWYRLLEEGRTVTVATPAGQAVTGQHGYRVKADTPIREVNPAEYDLLFIPGGQSPERLRLREEAVDIARTFMDEDRPVAAVGHSTPDGALPGPFQSLRLKVARAGTARCESG